MTNMEKLLPFKGEIISKYLSGISTNKLADEYKVNGYFIWKLIKDNGVQLRKYTNIPRGKSFELFGERVKEMVLRGCTAADIRKELNLTYTTINTIVSKLNLDIKRGWIDNDLDRYKDEIISMYINDDLATTEICKKYNCNCSAIWRILNKYGIDTTREMYNFDDTFFDKVDTEEKAYVLGLFYTDGNNIKNTVRISMCDRDMIEIVKKAMKAEQPIYEKPGATEKHKTQYELAITRAGFSDKLTKLGCPPNKTFILTFPGEDILPKDLQRHFIRGCFDGDGSITDTCIFFTGTIPLLKGIEDVVYDKLGFKFNWYHRYPEKGEDYPIRMSCLSKQEKIIKMIEYMYVDAKIYGDRKYHRCIQYTGRKSK
jgi:hypothetical protein